MQPRYSLIEALRAFSALTVVLCHFLLYSWESGSLYGGFKEAQPVFQLLVTVVFIFFFLSAIVIPVHQWNNDYHIRDFGRYFLKRFLRLYLPLIVILTATIGLEWLFAMKNNQPFHADTRKLLGNYTLTAEFLGVSWYNSIFWTVAIEIQFYLFMGLMFGLFKRFQLLFIVAFLVVGETLHLIYPDSRLLHFYTPFLAAGFLTFLYLKGNVKIAVFITGLILAGVVTWCFHNPFGVWVLFPLPLILLLKRCPEWMVRIGYFSYSIYLVHGITGGQFLYFTRDWGSSFGASSIRLLCAFGITLGFSWVFYKLIEKPATRLTQRIRYRRS